MKRRPPRTGDAPPAKINVAIDPMTKGMLERMAAGQGVSLSLLVSRVLEREAEAAGHGG